MLTYLFLSLIVGVFTYFSWKFTARVSARIPYAGEGSIASRLKVPVEYAFDPPRFLNRQRKLLGDIFCVDFIVTKMVFVLGPKASRAFLRASATELDSWEVLPQVFGPRMYDVISDPEFFQLSLKTLKALFTKPSFMEQFLSLSSDIINEHFDKFSAPSSVPLFSSFAKIINAVFTVGVFGEEFYRHHGEEMEELMSQFDKDLFSPFIRVVPWKLWWAVTPCARFMRTQNRLQQLVEKEAESLYKLPRNILEENHTYLAQFCLRTDKKHMQFFGMHITSILFAAYPNASNTVPWLFVHAHRKPGVINRLREEFEKDVAFGKFERPFWEACFRETARLYTTNTIARVVPSSYPKKYLPIMGYDIPRGTMIVVSPLGTQQDSELYDDPEIWRPGRWLDEDPNKVTSFNDRERTQKLEFIQFGYGTHYCTGEKLARTLLETIMEIWMRQYDVEVVGGLEGESYYDMIKEGEELNVHNVGIKPDWARNPGTPLPKIGDVFVKIKKRT